MFATRKQTPKWSCQKLLIPLAILLVSLALLRAAFYPAAAPPDPVPCTQQLPLQNSQPEPAVGLPSEFEQVDFSVDDCQKTLTSQHGEEKFLFRAFWSRPKPMTNGFYLELGAFDGVVMSNTNWLDKCLGWKGLLIEGHPRSVEKLKVNRPNADILGEAICEKEGWVMFVGTDDGVAGDIARMPPDFARTFHRDWEQRHEESHNVTCGPLSTRLASRGIKHIDFWTLDVEGAEWSVLNSFDWKATAVHVLVIENDKDEAKDKARRHEFLVDKNFELRGTLANNELWVNPENARANMQERAVMFEGSDYLRMGLS